MIENSIGNITEILHLLDDEIYTSEEIAEHYAMLIEKWGEWEIIGADTGGLIIRYVDIRNALFSGFMITYTILFVVCIILSIAIGKILLPQLAKMYTNNNDEMVDVATLKSAQQINTLSTKKNKEWF